MRAGNLDVFTLYFFLICRKNTTDSAKAYKHITWKQKDWDIIYTIILYNSLYLSTLYKLSLISFSACLLIPTTPHCHLPII